MELPDHVGALTVVITAQAATIQEQQRTIHALSGGRSKSLTLDMPIRELWDRYLQSLPDKPWVLSVKCGMIKFLDYCGDRPVSDLTVPMWEDFRDSKEIRDHYSVTSRNLQRKWLRAMLNWAVRSGRVAVNQLAMSKPEKGKKKRQTEVSRDGEAAVLAVLDPLMTAFFLAGIDSAMRHSEIRMLEWTEIDWATRQIRIPAFKTKTNTERTVRQTPRTLAAIRALPRVPGSPYVFANPQTRRPFTQSALWVRWDKARTTAGLKAAPGDGTVHFHDTRASAASRLARLGAKLPAIQAILGHASLATTAHYVKVQSRDVEEAHALLERSLRRGPHRAPHRPPASVRQKANS